MTLRNTIRLFWWELKSMPVYENTVPTGTTMWKQWRRGPLEVCQYVPHHEPGYVGIRYFRVQLLHGPRPRRWEPPDWGRTFAFGRHSDGYRGHRSKRSRGPV